jgi:hypothetical protein
LYDNNQNIIDKQLNSFIQLNGKLDGAKMQDNWFPQIKSDIFISHSHEDERMAIGLAGWLKEKFNLFSFIDSCVWGNANDLLKVIDKKYCWNNNKKMYDYKSRNQSTSHIHMMLSTALTMMMDKTECVFFLNTPHSISTKDVISKTESPWIYFEMAMTKFLIKREPNRPKPLMESSLVLKYLIKSIEYPISIKDDIPVERLKIWEQYWADISSLQKEKISFHPLDVLYELYANKK